MAGRVGSGPKSKPIVSQPIRLFLAWWLQSGRELAPLRLIPTAGGLQWSVIAAGVVALERILLQRVVVVRRPEKLERVHQQARDLCQIAPQSRTEVRIFVLLSITAGIWISAVQPMMPFQGP